MPPHHRQLFQASALSLGLPRSRTWAYRAVIAGLLLLSLTLLAAGQRQPQFTDTLRATITAALLPLVEVVSQPAESMNAALQWTGETVNLYSENAQLRQANARLTQWQAIALELQYENQALRRLLQASFAQDMKFRTARVVTGGAGTFAHSLLINIGEDQGVRKHQAVINAAGLVGSVIEADGERARVLLVTDINARTPVLLERTRDRAILAGQNSGEMSLMYLEDPAQVQPGDRLVTSGDGHTLPPGLPVGEVTDRRGDQVSVRPLVSASRLDYVRVVEY